MSVSLWNSEQPSKSFDKALAKRLIGRLELRHRIDHALMGAEGARAFVRRALLQAAQYGLEGERNIALFLDLMVVFGANFADDPQLVWATDGLHGRPKQSISELHRAAVAYARDVAGPDGARYLRALLRADGAVSGSASGWTSPEQAASTLERIHPEKFRWMKPRLASSFAVALSQTRTLTPEVAGVPPVFLTLMFLLGAHFVHDPRYPWAREALSSTQPQLQRYAALHAAAVAARDGALALLKRSQGDRSGL